MRRQTLTFDRESAELLAIDALSFLAQAPERLQPFLALTGVSPKEIRTVARAPHFLAAVLDHIAGNEALLLEFAGESGRRPADVMQARSRLAGAGGERDTA